MHTITFIMDEQGLKAQVLNGILVMVQVYDCKQEYLLRDQHEGLRRTSASLNTDLQYHCTPSLNFFFLLVKAVAFRKTCRVRKINLIYTKLLCKYLFK